MRPVIVNESITGCFYFVLKIKIMHIFVEREENKMITTRSKKFVTYVVPTVLGQVSFLLFTIIDGIFVGQGVGTNALGAVNIVMPFVMIVNAVFMLTSIGGVTISAVRFGRGDIEGANQAFMNAMFFNTVFAVILSAIGIFFKAPICTLFGATDTFHEMSMEYLLWYSIFIIPSSFSALLQNYCRNDGSPMLVSIATLVSTACNIFLDWLLIFPIHWGLKGAAVATGISQCIALLIVLSHFIQKKGNLRFKRVKLQGQLLKKIIIRGMPECIAQFSTPVTTILMNRVLAERIGDTAVNVYSIISYVASFSMGIFFGTSEGLQPLFGQSYGAKNGKDLKYYFRSGMLVNVIGGTFINLLLLIAAKPICSLFGATEETLNFALTAMPQYAWGFILFSMNVMISAYLYSTKRSVQAAAINFLRSFIVNSVMILTLPLLFGNDIIWSSFGIYEGIVLVVAVILLKNSEKKGIVYQ